MRGIRSGLHISSKGVLTDVLFYSPYKANLGPDMKIVAVNGRHIQMP